MSEEICAKLLTVPENTANKVKKTVISSACWGNDGFCMLFVLQSSGIHSAVFQ